MKKFCYVLIILVFVTLASFGTQQVINRSPAGSGAGDSLYTAFGKVNDNFTELYSSWVPFSINALSDYYIPRYDYSQNRWISSSLMSLPHIGTRSMLDFMIYSNKSIGFNNSSDTTVLFANFNTNGEFIIGSITNLAVMHISSRTNIEFYTENAFTFSVTNGAYNKRHVYFVNESKNPGEYSLSFWLNDVGSATPRERGLIYAKSDGAAPSYARTTISGIDAVGNTLNTLNVKNTSVGVNTTNPVTSFHVQGNGSLGAITLDAGGAYTNYKATLTAQATNESFMLTIGGDKILSTYGFTNADSVGLGNKLYTDLVYLGSNGSVGIGTTSPVAKLSLNGGLHVGGTTDPGDNNAIIDGTLNVGNLQTPWAKFAVCEASSVSYGFGVDTNGVIAGATSFRSGFRITPDGLGYSHAKMIGARDVGATYASYLAFFTESKASGTNDTSTEKVRIANSGNVGIGTTTPLAKLAINGGLHVGGDSDPGDDSLMVDVNAYVAGTNFANVIRGTNYQSADGTVGKTTTNTFYSTNMVDGGWITNLQVFKNGLLTSWKTNGVEL